MARAGDANTAGTFLRHFRMKCDRVWNARTQSLRGAGGSLQFEKERAWRRVRESGLRPLVNGGRKRVDSPRPGDGRRRAIPSRLRPPGTAKANGHCSRHVARTGRIGIRISDRWTTLPIERSVHGIEDPGAPATALAADALGPFPPGKFQDAHAGRGGCGLPDRKARKFLWQGFHLPQGTRTGPWTAAPSRANRGFHRNVGRMQGFCAREESRPLARTNLVTRFYRCPGRRGRSRALRLDPSLAGCRRKRGPRP